MCNGIKKEKRIKRKKMIAKNITDAVDITSDKSDNAQIHIDLVIENLKERTNALLKNKKSRRKKMII